MKTSRNQHLRQSKPEMAKMPRPEIRDNLDSRKNEEQDMKGDDSTHNRKATKSSGKHK